MASNHIQYTLEVGPLSAASNLETADLAIKKLKVTHLTSALISPLTRVQTLADGPHGDSERMTK